MVATETFEKLHLSWQELSTLPKDQVAALGLTAHVSNEINVLYRLFVLSDLPPSGDTVADAAALMQRMVLLRLISAKTFEFCDFISGVDKDQKSTDPLLAKVRDELKSSYQVILRDRKNSLAAYLRHEATNHYTLSAGRKNAEKSLPDADCSIFLHENGASSFYPLGEHLMFYGRMERKQDQQSSDADRKNLVDGWIDWVLKAKGLIDCAFASMVKEFVLPVFPNLQAESYSMTLPEVYIDNEETMRLPVVMRRTQ